MQKFDYSFIRQAGFDTRKMKNGDIHFYEKKNKTLSVSSSSAQSARLCAMGFDWCKVSSELMALVSTLKYKSPMYYDLFMIMYYSGCRVSEVLKLTSKDIISNSQVFLHASKNSDDRIITIPLVDLSQYLNWSDSSINIFNLSRFQVYRFSKSVFLSKVLISVFEDKPTKLFRYCYASMLYQRTNNLNLVAHTLGHKVVENSKYYIYGFNLVGNVD